MHTKIRLHSWQLTSCLFEYYQSMVDGIRKLDFFFFFHLQRKDCMEMCICICEYSSTVNCASVFVNIRYTPRQITNTIRYVYLTTSPNIRIYRGTPMQNIYFIMDSSGSSGNGEYCAYINETTAPITADCFICHPGGYSLCEGDG